MARRRRARGDAVGRRATRSRRALRLQPVERLLFISGAVMYLIGLFGETGLFAMPGDTSTMLLALSGAIQIAILLRLLL